MRQKPQTLLYMLIQKAGEQGGTRPPPGVPPPNWEALSSAWSQRAKLEGKQEPRVTLGPAQVSLGHNDYEEDDMVVIPRDDEDHEFGWDNEHPKRLVKVEKFSIERRPVTNGEYHGFWRQAKDVKLPASWVVKDGHTMVNPYFGLYDSPEGIRRFAHYMGLFRLR